MSSETHLKVQIYHVGMLVPFSQLKTDLEKMLMTNALAYCTTKLNENNILYHSQQLVNAAIMLQEASYKMDKFSQVITIRFYL